MPEHIKQGTLHEQIRNAEYHIKSELALIDKHMPKNAIKEKEKSSKRQ